MNLKRIAEIAPFLSALLIFAGYLRQNTYYSHWGVNILEHMQLTELLLLFLKDLNLLFKLLLFLIIQALLGQLVLRVLKIFPLTKEFAFKVDAVAEFKDVHLKSDEGDSGKLTKKQTMSFISLLLFFLTSLIWFKFKESFISLYFVLLCFIQMLIVGLELFFKVRGKINMMNTLVVLTIISFAYWSGEMEVRNIIDKPKEVKLIFLDDNYVRTNEELVYLGQTETTYIFHVNIRNSNAFYNKEGVKMSLFVESDAK
jgi:hypothetical protein